MVPFNFNISNFSLNNSFSHSMNDTILNLSPISLPNLINILIILSFFLVVIPFFHATTIYLTSKIFIKEKKRTGGFIFIHYLLLLFETAMLFLIADNLNLTKNNLFFIYLLLMMCADTLWIIVNVVLKKLEIPTQWLYINFLTILFLFYFIILLYNPVFDNHLFSQNPYVYLTFFIVLLCRTVSNYKFGWRNIYSKNISPVASN
jgi:hypothetical protein